MHALIKTLARRRSQPKNADQIPGATPEVASDRPWRVAQVLFDGRIGGPQLRVLRVSPELRALGYETHLVLPSLEQGAGDAARQAGVPVHRCASHKIPRPTQVRALVSWLLCLPRDARRFARFYRDEDIAIAVVNGAFNLAPALGARLAGRRLVWFLNDTLPPPWMAWLLGRIVAILAHAVVCQGGAVARTYYLPPRTAHIIYSAVDARQYRPRSSASPVPDGTIHIGTIANINRLKGIEVLIDAGHRLSRMIADKRVVIHVAGQKVEAHADYWEELQSLIDRRGLRDSVIFHGFVHDIATFLHSLDCYVMASHLEACPNTVLEAMACGVPVVSTDVGCVRELLDATTADLTSTAAGLVVARADAEAMAGAIHRLLRDPDLAAQLVRRGLELVESRFTVERHSYEIARILEQVGRSARE